MDNFFKNLKEKLSFDNLFGMLKDSKVAQDLAQQEIKKSLENLDPRNLTTDEITTKLSNAADQSKQIFDGVSKIVTKDTLKNVVDGVTIINNAKESLTASKISSHTVNKDIKNENNTKTTDDSDEMDPVWDV